MTSSLGHELAEADLPGLTPEIGAAISTVFDAATAWIVGYWIRHQGREPSESELDPLTRAYWERGRTVTAGQYLLAIEDLQVFSRRVAEFLERFDMWLTPTMSEPPAPLGEIVSTEQDPWRAARRGGRTVGYPAVVANISGNPAMSIPLYWTADGLPMGVHFLGRFGGEAALFRLAGQLEQARPWAERTPPIHATTAPHHAAQQPAWIAPGVGPRLRAASGPAPPAHSSTSVRC